MSDVYQQSWLDALFSRSERLLAIGFLLLIVLGTILLSLPVASVRNDISILDALFTSTSAVCVTGLIVVDTGKDFTLFGQIVILVLIQAGGLGIMTFTAMATQFLGGKLSFRSQAALSDTFYQKQAARRVSSNLFRIIMMVFIIEAIGAVILFLGYYLRSDDLHDSIFAAIFHAVSAFCNAGFSTHSDSLIGWQSSSIVMPTIAVLIILGGLGHVVVLESWARLGMRLKGQSAHPFKWTLHSRVVIYLSGVLILGGAVILMVARPFGADGSATTGFFDALFQSVTCRTAGFNSIDLTKLPVPALLFMCALMFIGGSPASCAGGVKTSSVATWYAQLYAWLRGQKEVTLMGRRLSSEIVAKAAMIIGLAVVWNSTGTILLAWFEQGRVDLPLRKLFFEQVSAFGTVGLSLDVTPTLSTPSRIWIMISMFVGRVGPLTFAMVISEREQSPIRYPEEPVMIG